MAASELKRVKELAAVAIICILTIVGLLCAAIGINVLPKCRYGSPDCYFVVEACAYDTPRGSSPIASAAATQGGGNGRRDSSLDLTQRKSEKPQFCHKITKLRAIEGSNSGTAEQLAIPVLAVITACVPGIVTFCSIAVCPRFLGLLEFAKFWLAGSFVFLVLGIRGIQDLTFDCRWWGTQHHSNGPVCHEGLNLYVASSLLLLLGQVALLLVCVHFSEARRMEMVKDL
jgi:hypothetical protein